MLTFCVLVGSIVVGVWLALCLLAVLGFGLGIWLIWGPNEEDEDISAEIRALYFPNGVQNVTE